MNDKLTQSSIETQKRIYCLIALCCLTMSACTPLPKHPDNKPVRMIFHNEINLVKYNKNHECKYLGTLISSEGYWYTYWFMSNSDIARGAYHDMHNKANEIGANVVYIDSNIDFVTSVTLVGQAYACEAK
jgi:hypothetical protein